MSARTYLSRAPRASAATETTAEYPPSGARAAAPPSSAAVAGAGPRPRAARHGAARRDACVTRGRLRPARCLCAQRRARHRAQAVRKPCGPVYLDLRAAALNTRPKRVAARTLTRWKHSPPSIPNANARSPRATAQARLRTGASGALPRLKARGAWADPACISTLTDTLTYKRRARHCRINDSAQGPDGVPAARRAPANVPADPRAPRLRSSARRQVRTRFTPPSPAELHYRRLPSNLPPTRPRLGPVRATVRLPTARPLHAPFNFHAPFPHASPRPQILETAPARTRVDLRRPSGRSGPTCTAHGTRPIGRHGAQGQLTTAGALPRVKVLP
ncbi:hypothetical protein HYPSUDRAFT_197104 [Hypholoma sublateritium FD-334 SS-4]|uniref:Uncharacterized protein n=1 Tax=Hypholoma sublateritium (strain FD-334 SS-4) TaxID=945553 RepID=A0A0D2PDQ0_HYPSF|nr:hypothetical protein HYPSUDRAFT_197104 [Hypholoma sublateritium FD-334 SS-4]